MSDIARGHHDAGGGERSESCEHRRIGLALRRALDDREHVAELRLRCGHRGIDDAGERGGCGRIGRRANDMGKAPLALVCEKDRIARGHIRGAERRCGSGELVGIIGHEGAREGHDRAGARNRIDASTARYLNVRAKAIAAVHGVLEYRGTDCAAGDDVDQDVVRIDRRRGLSDPTHRASARQRDHAGGSDRPHRIDGVDLVGHCERAQRARNHDVVDAGGRSDRVAVRSTVDGVLVLERAACAAEEDLQQDLPIGRLVAGGSRRTGAGVRSRPRRAIGRRQERHDDHRSARRSQRIAGGIDNRAGAQLRLHRRGIAERINLVDDTLGADAELNRGIRDGCRDESKATVLNRDLYFWKSHRSLLSELGVNAQARSHAQTRP